MAYQLLYHPSIRDEDIPSINAKLSERIRRAIEQRLLTEPSYYGQPLRHRLKGYWKLRVGDYRVIYQIVGLEVWVLAIGHRKEVYAVSPRRLFWRP